MIRVPEFAGVAHGTITRHRDSARPRMSPATTT